MNAAAVIENSATTASLEFTLNLPFEYGMKVVGEVASLIPLALEAYVCKDFARFWKRHDAIRACRAELSDLLRYAGSIDPSPSSTLAHVEQMRVGLQIIRTFDDFHQSACMDYTTRSAELHAIEDPIAANWLIEYSLQREWNFKSDFLVVIGRPTVELTRVIADRGIKRWGFFSALDEQDSGETANLGNSLQSFEVGLTIEFERRYPKSVSIVNVPDESLDEERRQAAFAIVTNARVGAGTSLRTLDHFAHQFVWQTASNLPRVLHSVDPQALKTVFQGCPALIVSPGPSLDKNIHKLKSINDRVVIIAVAQALKALHSAGVKPHIICVLDPQDLSKLFEGVPIDDQQILFIKVSCHPKLFELGYSRYVIFSSDSERWVETLFGRSGSEFFGASVSLTATSLAYSLAPSEIILIGQDLAVVDGRRYSLLQQRENKGHARLLNESRTFLQLKSFDESGFVTTTPDLHFFHRLFEQIAAQIKNQRPGLLLTNATEGGAYIKGFDHNTLECVLSERLKSWDKIPTVDAEEWNRLINKGMELNSVRRRISNLKREVESILIFLEKFKKVLSLPISDKRRVKLSRLERQLSELISSYPFFAIPFRRNLEQVSVLSRFAESEADLDNLTLKIIETLGSTIRKFSPYLDGCLSELDGCLSERK